MTISIKTLQRLEQQPTTFTTNTSPLTNQYLDWVGHIDVACTVRLGTLTLTIDALRQLKSGDVLPLHQKTNEPIEIILHHQVVARGDLVQCGDCFAIKITETAS